MDTPSVSGARKLPAAAPVAAAVPILTASLVIAKAAAPATPEDAPDIVPFSTVPRSVLSRALSTNSPVNYVAS